MIAAALLSLGLALGVDAADVAGSSLLRVHEPAGWNMALVYEDHARDTLSGGRLSAFDADFIGARIGYELFSGLNLHASAGSVRGDFDSVRGERGFGWIVGANVGLVDYTFEDRPNRQMKQALRLGGGVSYSDGNSSLPGSAELDWNELRVTPSVTYVADLRAPGNLSGHDAQVVALTAGLVFSTLDGDAGSTSFEENSDFGLHLDIDVLLPNQWVFGGEANIFDSEDRSIALILGYHF